jgi:TonB family protein
MRGEAVAGILFAGSAIFAPPPPLPAWMQVDSRHSSQEAQDLYGGWVKEEIDKAVADPAKRVDWLATNKRSGSNENWVRRHLESRPKQEKWRFFDGPKGEWPNAAYRLQIPTGGKYVVKVDIYCSDENDTCPVLWRELTAMRSPRPAGNGQVLAAWRELVATETCDPLQPVAMPPPPTPREELRRGIQGDVEVSVFANRCGDVRDAELAKSSGNRGLDRGALKGVLRWRVPTTGRAGWSRHSVSFHEAAEPMPEHNIYSVPSDDGGRVQPQKR